MDIRFFLKVYLALIYINEVSTDLQFYVTKDVCDITVDLAAEGRLVLDYDGADLGQQLGSLCVITIQNSDSNKAICAKSNATVNFACSLIFQYHIGDYPSSFLGNGHSCYDLHRQPLCKRTSPVFATFQNIGLIFTAYVQVEFYLAPVTTTRVIETTTWSYGYTEPESRSLGTIIGLTIGGVFLLTLLVACAYLRRKTIFDSQSGQRFNVQYQQGHQNTNQQFVSSVPQQYTQSTTVSQENNTQNSTNLAGYHVHPTVSLTLTDQQGSTTEQSRQNSTSPQSVPVDPSAPPPPYPGY